MVQLSICISASPITIVNAAALTLGWPHSIFIFTYFNTYYYSPPCLPPFLLSARLHLTLLAGSTPATAPLGQQVPNSKVQSIKYLVLRTREFRGLQSTSSPPVRKTRPRDRFLLLHSVKRLWFGFSSLSSSLETRPLGALILVSLVLRQAPVDPAPVPPSLHLQLFCPCHSWPLPSSPSCLTCIGTVSRPWSHPLGLLSAADCHPPGFY